MKGHPAIVTHPHPALLIRAALVDHTNPELPGLIALMLDAMRVGNGVHKGVGLAANQVGRPLRVIVTNFSPQAALNPDYEQHRRSDLVEDIEGCLSDPGSKYLVIRHSRIVATWSDVHTGRPKTCELRDMQARIWQHECDHLNGVSIRDVGEPVSSPNRPPAARVLVTAKSSTPSYPKFDAARCMVQFYANYGALGEVSRQSGVPIDALRRFADTGEIGDQEKRMLDDVITRRQRRPQGVKR